MLAFFTPNPEQVKMLIRWAIGAFGAGLAGWFAHSGYVSQQQVMDLLNSPAFLSMAVSVAMAIWGMIAHTQSNAVAVVAKIAADPNSPVVGILTTSNVEGRALAASIPHAEIAPVGSVGATNIASDSVPPMTEKTSPGPNYPGSSRAP